MILIDTSVRVEHLSSGNATLAGELGAGRVLAHLLASAALAAPARLWTRDGRLAAVALELNLAWE